MMERRVLRGRRDRKEYQVIQAAHPDRRAHRETRDQPERKVFRARKGSPGSMEPKDRKARRG